MPAQITPTMPAFPFTNMQTPLPMPPVPADMEKVLTNTIEKIMIQKFKNPSEEIEEEMTDKVESIVLDKKFLKRLHKKLSSFEDSDEEEDNEDEEVEVLSEEDSPFEKLFCKLKEMHKEVSKDKMPYEIEEEFFKEVDLDDDEKRVFSCFFRNNFPKMLDMTPDTFFKIMKSIGEKL